MNLKYVATVTCDCVSPDFSPERQFFCTNHAVFERPLAGHASMFKEEAKKHFEGMGFTITKEGVMCQTCKERGWVIRKTA